MPKRRPQPKHTNAYDLTISYATSHKCGTKGIKEIYKQNQQYFSIYSFDPTALEMKQSLIQMAKRSMLLFQTEEALQRVNKL